MQATIFCVVHCTKHDPLVSSNHKSVGRPVEVQVKLDYQCPCAGVLVPVANSCKRHFTSWQCGCEAWFSICCHIPTNSFLVAQPQSTLTWGHATHSGPLTCGKVASRTHNSRMGWKQLQKLLNRLCYVVLHTNTHVHLQTFRDDLPFTYQKVSKFSMIKCFTWFTNRFEWLGSNTKTFLKR